MERDFNKEMKERSTDKNYKGLLWCGCSNEPIHIYRMNHECKECKKWFDVGTNDHVCPKIKPNEPYMRPECYFTKCYNHLKDWYLYDPITKKFYCEHKI